MPDVEVVVAHPERATLRVGDTFLKIDPDPDRTAVEVFALGAAPVPVPAVLWHRPPVLALAEVPGRALERLGRPASASVAAWAAAGATVRRLHSAPVPAWPSRNGVAAADGLDEQCAWVAASGLVDPALVARNRERAEIALRPRPPVFVHGDLQVAHVFIDDDDEVTGIIDWSEAGAGDRHHDLAVLTLAHPDRLPDLLAGYGGSDVELEAIHGWWSLRSLTSIRWLVEHGYDPATPGGEIDILSHGW